MCLVGACACLHAHVLRFDAHVKVAHMYLMMEGYQRDTHSCQHETHSNGSIPRHSTFNIQHSTFNIQHSKHTSNTCILCHTF
jgi:hypothetical protein